VAKYGAGAGERVIALTRLQGCSSCHFPPREQAPDLLDAFEAAGLKPVQWEQYQRR
jgi:hypothetical protein